jgi:integrase
MEVSESTSKQYDAMLEWLLNQGLDIEEPDVVVAAMCNHWKNPSTQKTKLALLKGYLNRRKDFDKAILSRYSILLDELVKSAKKPDAQEATEKEKENWLDWEKVVEFGESLKKTAIANWNEKNYVGALEDALLVAFYTDLSAVRNDYANIYFTDSKPNWLNLKTGELTINEHKTAKSVGALTRQIPPTLMFMIHTLLMKSPRDVLFHQNESALSARLIRLFEKGTGKKIGSTMLRHISITHQQKGEQTLKEKKQLASDMGHSITTQTVYRRPGLE